MELIAETYLLLLVRILLTLLAMVYTVFAVLMSRQIGIMTRAVSMKDSVAITFFGYLHLVFALIVLLWVLIAL